MKIGLSLPYTYLSNHIVNKDKLFTSSFGPADKALSDLSPLIDYVELSNFSTQASPDEIVVAVMNVWEHGLKVSLHPSLPEDVEGKTLAEIYPWLPPLLAEMDKYQDHLLLNLHALAAAEGDIEQLRSDSIKNLRIITNMITTEKHALRIALELNRSKGTIDPCTTFEGVLHICRQVDSPVLGISWDFGHGFSNYQNNLISRIPPGDFLDRTIHTHIHDISPDGKTHWPLTSAIVPLDEYLNLLADHGYRGIFMLEMMPDRFSILGNIKEQILKSIEILSKSIAGQI